MNTSTAQTVVDFIDDLFKQMCLRPAMYGDASQLEFCCLQLINIREVALGLPGSNSSDWIAFVKKNKKGFKINNGYLGRLLITEHIKECDEWRSDPIRPEDTMMAVMDLYWHKVFPSSPE